MYDSDELRALAKATHAGSRPAKAMLRRAMTPETVLELLDEIERLREICAAVYQLAGAMNAPVRFLDALSDAANGEIGLRAPTDTLLPVDPAESGSFAAWSDEGWKNDAERYRAIRQGAVIVDASVEGLVIITLASDGASGTLADAVDTAIAGLGDAA
jgi:hypothetical protein